MVSLQQLQINTEKLYALGTQMKALLQIFPIQLFVLLRHVLSWQPNSRGGEKSIQGRKEILTTLHM